MLTVVVAGGIFTLPLYSGSTPTNTSINAALSAITTTVLLLGDTGTRFAFAANNGAHSEELWRSDGTAAGTVMVKDIRAGSDGSYPGYITFMPLISRSGCITS